MILLADGILSETSKKEVMKIEFSSELNDSKYSTVLSGYSDPSI